MVNKIKILKDGNYNGFYYKKGEIYKARKNGTHWFLDVNNSYGHVILCAEEDIHYGKEAELIEIEKIYELWK